jgi:Na+/melibiose symporter-like transporter
MRVTFIHGFSSLGWALVNAIMLGYVDKVLMLKGLDLYIAAGVLMIGLLVTIEIWRRLIRKWGKKRTLLSVFIVGIVAFPFSILGLFTFSVNLGFGILFMFFLATTQAGWALFPYILYADLAEDFQKNHGEMRAGLFTGFPSILLNIFQAISLFFTGFILGLSSVENVPGNSFSLGYVIWGPICSVIFIFTFIFIKKYVKVDFDWEKKGKESAAPATPAPPNDLEERS